jgi:hypothetical protein
MTLLSEASFLVTPNGYKASKLYAAIPTNGDGDMTVTRATTATRVDENDLVSSVASNVPRIDYTGGGCPSILLEPQRTNLITYSEDFTEYTNSNTTDTANTVTSPDGTVNGTTLTASGSGSLNHIITSPEYTIASGEITSSIFAKKGTVNYIRLRLNGTTSSERAWYNLNNGTIDGEDVSGSAKIEDYGNGWYRCSLTSSSNIASGSGKSLQIFIQDSGGSQTAWTANGTENIYIWGTQTEQGAYHTSYIPTTTATVTRNADAISKTGISDLLNPSEGTFYAEISALANDLTYRILSLNDGTGDNAVQIALGNVSNQIRLDTYGQGANYRSTVTVLDTTENHKVLIKWGPSGIFGFVDGDKYTLTLAAGTGSGIPTALNRINFSIWWGGNSFYGKCKGVQIYKTALSDPQCQALTTL